MKNEWSIGLIPYGIWVEVRGRGILKQIGVHASGTPIFIDQEGNKHILGNSKWRMLPK